MKKPNLRQIINEEILKEESPQMIAKNYPEITKAAKRIAKQVERLVNSEAKKIKSDMLYKAQGILEELIRILKRAV